MSLRTPVGIDLGTTFCAAARINEAGRTEMVEIRPGRRLLPSLVHFGPNDVFVGNLPAEGNPSPRTVTIPNAKRRLAGSDRLCDVDGKPVPAEVVLGYLLKDVKRAVAAQIGPAFCSVITVPAYFDELRRQAIANAGKLSGLDVIDIINEPTAAVLAFGERLGYLDPTGAPCESLNVLVYDLGGGTFDVTAIRLSNQEVITLATDGDTELGGLNWDECMAQLLWERYEEAVPAGEMAVSKNDHYWLKMANYYKHSLAESPIVNCVCEAHAGPQQIGVTRDEFEEATAHLTDRTLFTTRECLKAAGWAWGDIDRLILVGGSTRMPAIREAIKRESRLEPEQTINPDEAVARGAAIYAQSRLTQRGISTVARELAITNVSSHSLGIVGVDVGTLHREVVHLIAKNKQLPAEVERDFVTRADGQTSVEVQVTEGESSSPEHNQVIGKARIMHLPPGLPAGTRVRVKYAYDANGRLSVSAEVPGAGAPARLDLKREKTLSNRQLSGWTEVVNSRGGFDDFSDAVLSLLDDPEPEGPSHRITTHDDNPAVNKSTQRRSLDPACPTGAPMAASERLKQAADSKPSGGATPQPGSAPVLNPHSAAGRTRKRASNPFVRFVVQVTMSVLSAAVGLGVGYYLLCALRPEANVLNLRLPGLESPTPIERPAVGP